MTGAVAAPPAAPAADSSTGAARARTRWPATLAGAIVVLDVAIFLWCGVAPARIALFALFLAISAGSGALILRGRESAFPDRASFAVVATALGLALHMTACFLVFHFAEGHAPARIVLAALAALSALAAIGLRRRVAALPACRHPRAAVAVLALASVMGIGSHGGFANDLGLAVQGLREPEENTVVADYLARYREPGFDPRAEHAPEWGSRVDSVWYVWLYTRSLRFHGLPGAFYQQKEDGRPRIGQFQHLGVSTQIFGLSQASGRYSAENLSAFSKMLALAWCAILSSVLFLVARFVFGAPVGAALVAVGCGLLYAPLNLSFLLSHRTMLSNVLTYVAGPIQWNLNQLSHLAIGGAGLFLVLLDLARPRRTYAIGCALVAVSLMYKPSLYFVAVPAIGLASLRLGRGFFRADVLLGWALIFAAAACWFAYPRIVGSRAIATPLDFGFLTLQAEYVRDYRMLPEGWYEALGVGGVKALILLFVYAALIVPAIALTRGLVGGLERRGAVLAALGRPEVLAVALMFVWGFASGAVLIENNQFRLCFNFVFGTAAAYTILFTMLVAVIARITKPSLRRLAWTILALHLASGVLNFVMYVSGGELV